MACTHHPSRSGTDNKHISFVTEPDACQSGARRACHDAACSRSPPPRASLDALRARCCARGRATTSELRCGDAAGTPCKRSASRALRAGHAPDGTPAARRRRWRDRWSTRPQSPRADSAQPPPLQTARPRAPRRRRARATATPWITRQAKGGRTRRGGECVRRQQVSAMPPSCLELWLCLRCQPGIRHVSAHERRQSARITTSACTTPGSGGSVCVLC
jgi:hypothetical protein